MSNKIMEYEVGNTAAAFVNNTNSRIDKSVLSEDANLSAIFSVLQDELSKALRIIDNSCISK